MSAAIFRKAAKVNFDELEQYLKEPLYDGEEDILTVWQTQLAPRFPHLAKMARDYLSVPGTTVGVERIFSGGGRVATPLRNRMAPMLMEKLMTLQNWIKYLERPKCLDEIDK